MAVTEMHPPPPSALKPSPEMKAALTPLPSEAEEPKSDDPRPLVNEAKGLQTWYLRLSTAASGFFVVGVVFAAFSVLR